MPAKKAPAAAKKPTKKTAAKTAKQASKTTAAKKKPATVKANFDKKTKTATVVIDVPRAADKADSAKSPAIWQGILSLILGILALFTSPLFVFSIPLGVLAIVFGVWSFKTTAKALGIAGLITASLGLLITIFVTAFVLFIGKWAVGQVPSMVENWPKLEEAMKTDADDEAETETTTATATAPSMVE